MDCDLDCLRGPYDFRSPYYLMQVSPIVFHRNGYGTGSFIALGGSSFDTPGILAVPASEGMVGATPDYSLIREWIGLCVKIHDDVDIKSGCVIRKPVATIAGFRVIDCVTRELIHLGSSMETEGYVTLSYVWGSPESSGAQSCHKYLPKQVPAVIEDAITVTKELGFRYLWVDRYCIPEDDDKAKHSQLRNMNHIYKSSELTIIDASNDGSSGGLAGVSKPRTPMRTIQVGSKSFVAPVFEMHEELRQSVWITRGWTQQEGALARRRLLFTSTQTYFQCGAVACFESLKCLDSPLLFGDPTVEHVQHNQLGLREPRSHLQRLELLPTMYPWQGGGLLFPRVRLGSLCNQVNKYCLRRFSFESDRMDAFQGLLREFGMGVPFHICGLVIVDNPGIDVRHSTPEEANRSLVYSLAWSYPGYAHLRGGFDPERSDLIRGSKTIPSWTYLGWRIEREGHSIPTYTLSWPTKHDLMFHSKNNIPKAVVEFEEHSRAPLDDNIMDSVLPRVHAGEKVEALRMTGWVQDFTLVINRMPIGTEYLAAPMKGSAPYPISPLWNPAKNEYGCLKPQDAPDEIHTMLLYTPCYSWLNTLDLCVIKKRGSGCTDRPYRRLSSGKARTAIGTRDGAL